MPVEAVVEPAIEPRRTARGQAGRRGKTRTRGTRRHHGKTRTGSGTHQGAGAAQDPRRTCRVRGGGRSGGQRDCGQDRSQASRLSSTTSARPEHARATEAGGTARASHRSPGRRAGPRPSGWTSGHGPSRAWTTGEETTQEG